MLTYEERNNLLNPSLIESNVYYWTMSPESTCTGEPNYRDISMYTSHSNFYGVGSSFGVRPVVSLKKGIAISSGTGSEEDPWIIE